MRRCAREVSQVGVKLFGEGGNGRSSESRAISEAIHLGAFAGVLQSVGSPFQIIYLHVKGD